MEKTKFTKLLRPALWMVLPLLALFFSNAAMAQSIACNNGVQVSVDPTPNGLCEVELTEDMVLEGNPDPNTDYLLEVMSGINVLYTGINTVIFDGNPHLGQTLTVRVTNQTTTNKCWGSISIEDKAKPVVNCFNQTINCTEDFNIVAFPDADDNCDAFPDVQLVDEVINTANQCSSNGGFVTVTRTFVAVDESGNQSFPCDQVITIQRPDDVDFPNDITWECDQYDQFPNITNAVALHPAVAALQVGTQTIEATGITNPAVLGNTGSGTVSNVIGTYCNYSVTHADQYIYTCGSTFKIVRTWTVLDWCTNSIITSNEDGEDNVQIVKVVDATPPTVTRPPFTVNANIPGQHPQPCTSQGFLPPATVSDNCHNVTVSIYTPVGEAFYINGQNGAQGGLIPAPGLQLGFHDVTYIAEDECGNIQELVVTIEVVDEIAPTTICDEITEVALTSNGEAIVPASVFDDGTYDNCCLDEFLVRRMDGDCDGNFDDFGPNVTFCCSDVPNNPIMVVFRAVDCYDNYNDCMVEVLVQDKLPPQVVCPQPATIDCEEYLEDLAAPLAAGDYSVLEVFGTASYFDNCATNVDYQVNVNINTCQEGTITRTWTITDDVPNSPAICTQTITVEHVSDWVVEFPANFTGNCVDGELPDTGAPEVFFDECELIGVSHSDVQFDIVPDACYKIVRTWTVINWCIYDDFGSDVYAEISEQALPGFQDWDGDGDDDNRTFRDGWNSNGTPGTPDGYIQWEQVIKVQDTEDPIFDVEDFTACIEDVDCDTDVELPVPDVTDCSSITTIVVTSADLAAYATADQYSYSDVPVGTYVVNYAVTDECGNTAYDQITVTVEDCKKPTPYCKNGLVIEIMQTGMVDVDAIDFDFASFDNCPGDLKFSFSPDVNDTERFYTCDSLGQRDVEIWVTDAAGNQDFCETFIQVQDNMGVCGNVVVIAGAIENEDADAIENVNVDLSGDGMFSAITDASGAYSFNSVPAGGDYTVTPMLNEDHDNGVSTYDVVLITKHILGVQPLNSPYKIISADANRSNSVTTTDIVEIRKIILQINEAFPNNNSWRFVDKTFDFPNPANPFSTVFPEVINFNNLNQDELFADFTALKVGDVNNSAQTASAAAAQDRSFNGTFYLQAEDQRVVAGQKVAVTFTAEEFAVLGYQFTLNFDQNALELADVIEGVAKSDNFGLTLLDEGAITASWNGEAYDNAELFTLEFVAQQDVQLSDVLTINSRFTAAEAYNRNGELMNVELMFNTGDVANSFELYQNVPNPFTGETVIGFNLPESGEALLKVFSVDGQMLKMVQGEFAKGFNSVRISAGELNATGVLYYTLETNDYTATKKMVLVK